MKSITPLLTVFAGIICAGSAAQAATTIYSETFSNGSVGTPSALNGSTPDITTAAATWVASRWSENGTTGTIVTNGNNTTNTSDDDSAFLAFTPVAGNVYTLSATMTVPAGGNTNGWVGLGFAATNTTTGSFWANGTAPWLLYRPSSEVVSFAESLSTAPNNDLGVATNNIIEGNYATSANFSIVLDTTGAAWTAEWFINAGSVRTETYGTNPTIGYVGFGRENGNTSAIDNFSLTVIPEPSVALLGGLGVIALLRRRR
jgi:hypothetical protein